MAATDRVTVKDLLDITCLHGTAVLAGDAGMDRLVTRLNVMEVPDVVDWVKPHELLVTSGFPIVSLAEAPHDAFVQLIRDLDQRQTAALGIKVGRYIDQIPGDVLRVADELGFPILGLPAPIAFDDLLQQVHTRLYDVHAGVLERIDALREALARIVLEGGDLGQIAAEVSRVLSVAVLATSTDGRIQASAISDELRQVLAGADLFDPTGRFRVERASGSLRVGDGQVMLQPVAAGGSDLARLVCFSPNRLLTPDDLHALERAATVAALLISREQAVNAVESKYRGDFLRDVFSGRAGETDFVVEHAAGLGWELRLPAVVISAELDPPSPHEDVIPSSVRRSWEARFAAAWRQVIRSYDRTTPTAEFSAEVVTLLPVPAAAPTDVQDQIRAAVAQLVTSVAGDRGGGRRPFSVGVSRPVHSLDDLPDAYAQARRATEVGRRINGGSSTAHFDDLGIHRILGLIADDGELDAFARDVLGELTADTTEAVELRATLQVLLDVNLNVAEASRIQFFHYNTMRYRISKLERLVGPFTTDPHLRLNIAVALQVCDIRT